MIKLIVAGVVLITLLIAARIIYNERKLNAKLKELDDTNLESTLIDYDSVITERKKRNRKRRVEITENETGE